MEEFMAFMSTFGDFFQEKSIVIPAIQMIYYVGIINILMLFKSYRSCFLISLAFSLYWLFVLNRDKFVSPEGLFEGEGFIYLGIGLLLLVLALFSFVTQSNVETD